MNKETQSDAGPMKFDVPRRMRQREKCQTRMPCRKKARERKPEIHCETCEGANLKRHFRSSITSISTSHSLPSTICFCRTFFGGNGITGYVRKFSYDHDRAVETSILQIDNRRKNVSLSTTGRFGSEVAVLNLCSSPSLESGLRALLPDHVVESDAEEQL